MTITKLHSMIGQLFFPGHYWYLWIMSCRNSNQTLDSTIASLRSQISFLQMKNVEYTREIDNNKKLSNQHLKLKQKQRRKEKFLKRYDKLRYWFIVITIFIVAIMVFLINYMEKSDPSLLSSSHSQIWSSIKEQANEILHKPRLICVSMISLGSILLSNNYLLW